MSAMPSREPMAVDVVEVSTGAHRNAFVRFPWKVQADDPAWVPPLLMDRKDFINRKKQPFFDHGDAALFLARRGGEVVGRVLASDDPRYNETHGSNVGCFGMFECIDDQSVADALMERAAAWIKAKGRDEIMGPIDYSTNYQCGLLVDGFDTPPRVMMNHNPPYYAGLLEGWGLEKAKDLWSWWVTKAQQPPERWRKMAERAKKRSGFTIRSADMKNFDAEVESLKTIYNDAWEDNWGFVKMTDAEFTHLAKDMKLLLDPEILLIAEIKGKAVGFSMALPDINEALKHIDGKLTTFGLPIGLGRLLYHQKRIKTIRLITLGVLSAYRRRGITESLILHTYDVGQKRGYDSCEMGWTLEDNKLINAPIEALGSKRYKTYRLYRRSLA